MGRTGWAATTAFSAAAITLAVYEVQGEKMPPVVASGIPIFMIIMGSIATGIVIIDGLKTIRPLLQPWGFRWPIYRRGRPNPLQWLLDVAQHDAENPQGELRILSQWVTDFDVKPETLSPWIEVGYEFFNGGVHTILIGPARGHAHYNGKRLSEEIEENKGRHRLQRGKTDIYKVKVFVPREIADAIYERELSIEVARSFRRMRSLSLSGVRLQVGSEPIGYPGTVNEIGLGANDTYLVGDTN